MTNYSIGNYNYNIENQVFGFIDDDESLQGRDAVGLPIMSLIEAQSKVKTINITDIYLAIPSVSRSDRNNILKSLLNLGVRIKTLPLILDFSKNDAIFNQIKNLDIDDLLLREEVISNEATVGIYNFQKGSDFVKAAEQMIAKNLRVKNEFYVAPAYNEMIIDQAKITIFNIGKEYDGMYGIGIPSDLEKFLKNPVSQRILN